MIHSLNPDYTFDRLILGSHNTIAHAAAMAIIESPGRRYNPLYISGDDHLAKTHLLQAIAWKLMIRNDIKRFLFTTAEDYVQTFTNSIREGQIKQLRETYRDIDLLLIDNIEYLAEHQGAMQEFLRLTNVLYEAQRQIVITSSYPPSQVPNLHSKLRSRFECGLIADILPLDVTTIAALLLRAAQSSENITLPNELALYIAQQISFDGPHRVSSSKYIEKILWEIAAHASSADGSLDEALVRQLFGRATLNNLFVDTVGKRVQVVNATPNILQLLRKDYSYIHQLPPDKVELLICDRLSHMGLDVQQVGSTYTRDGGVDLIATPSLPTPFPYLLAVQVKHHRHASRKTGPSAVKDLQAVVASSPFQAGLLVTSTSFTPTAHWFTENRKHLVRLRDMQDLKRWIWNNFADPAEWREIPSEIELSPGIVVKVPRKY